MLHLTADSVNFWKAETKRCPWKASPASLHPVKSLRMSSLFCVFDVFWYPLMLLCIESKMFWDVSSIAQVYKRQWVGTCQVARIHQMPTWPSSSRCLFKKRNWTLKRGGTATVAKRWSPKFGLMVRWIDVFFHQLNNNFQAQGSLQEIGVTRHAWQSFAKQLRREGPVHISFRFHQCPPVLVLQLKRFQHTGRSGVQCKVLTAYHHISLPASNDLGQALQTTEHTRVVSTGKPGPEPIPHGTELSRRSIFSIFSIVFSTSAFGILRGICKRKINSDSCPKPRQSAVFQKVPVAPVWLFRSMTLQQCVSTTAVWVVDTTLVKEEQLDSEDGWTVACIPP